MGHIMAKGAQRLLRDAEWARLSPGLATALRQAQVAPLIVARPSAPARIARLWRGRIPIMALGRRIYWPGAMEDMASPCTARAMAILQHELQHVLEYALGQLSPARYVSNARNWTYDYRLSADCIWSDFGAEQRASIVEHLWLIEHGLLDDQHGGARHRRVIPWAG
jgi:hypothetical protein